MCFKITFALREYYRYSGVSAELERKGYGSSRPELCWASRRKADYREDASDAQNEGIARASRSNQD